MYRIGIVGASGYTGAELLRLIAGHPEMEIAWATADTQAGAKVRDLYPSLGVAYPELRFESWSATLAQDCDLSFFALPHGESQALLPGVHASGVKVVDLAADFRLRDPAVYEHWYGTPHSSPALLQDAAYGLPELERKSIAPASLVAAPGCYPTAAALAIAPLLRAGVIEATGVIVDAASGLSGAGRTLKHASHFGTANEDYSAYGLIDHRHTPEIEQATGAQVLFTPHLAPMTRGILATCYARPSGAVEGTDSFLDVMSSFYAAEPFVEVIPGPPGTKAVSGSNCAHVTVRHDPRTGWVLAVAAIDNLVKGAAGQALQCANLMFGLDETSGLPTVGLYP